MRICASEMIDFMHKTNTMKLTIKPLSPDLLKDYLYFFDHVVFAENPDWSACYCFSFHFTGSNEQWKKETNRASACDFIKEGKLTGYLVYDDDKPIGWCNVNVRSNYQRLMKYYDLVDNPDDKVCSIVCFLIHPDYRRMGIAKKILQQINTDYSALDFDYLEAYPGKGELSSERHYKGPLSMYEKLDFKIKKEYDDYYVVRKRLK